MFAGGIRNLKGPSKGKMSDSELGPVTSITLELVALRPTFAPSNSSRGFLVRASRGCGSSKNADLKWRQRKNSDFSLPYLSHLNPLTERSKVAM